MKNITVAVLQPSYIPWIGYFNQIVQSDVFVFYDDVQYTKRDWRSRNYIKTGEGKLLLSVPVRHKGKLIINEIIIDYTQDWVHKHLESIKRNYSGSKYFKEIFPQLELILKSHHEFLSQLDITIIQFVLDYLNIKTQLINSSTLNIQGEQTQRLVDISRHFGATTYLTGNAAQNYLDIEAFKKHKIEVKFQNYEHPVYEQVNGEFIPYLSIIDLLFNYGKESIKIIKGEK